MNISQLYDAYIRPLPLDERLRLAERIVAQAAAEATEARTAPSAPPRETLGRRLRAIRARIEESGEALLDEEAMRAEVAERRGGAEASEHAEHADVR